MTGFLLAQAFMSFLGVYACLSTIMFGSGFLICVCNYSFQVELIAQDFAELDELWSRTKATSVKYRYAFLCNICMKLQDMKRYVNFNFILEHSMKMFCSFLVTWMWWKKSTNWNFSFTFSAIMFPRSYACMKLLWWVYAKKTIFRVMLNVYCECVFR